jgi:hypothetical protein
MKGRALRRARVCGMSYLSLCNDYGITEMYLLVEALRYKLEGRQLNSRGVSKIFH